MGIHSRLTKYVKILLIANIMVYLVDFLIDGSLDPLLGLQPRAAIYELKIWQFFTYMFIHSIDRPLHIFFNMYALWMFGGPVEEAMGSKKFIAYYFITGLGAAMFASLFSMDGLTIGASGAIFGLIIAFAIFYPNSIIYLFFVFPMSARNFALLFACIELFVTLTVTDDSIAHFAHVGGLITGYFYLKYYYKKDEFAPERESYAKVKIVNEKEYSAKNAPDFYSQERVDAILDKIRDSGIESLSREEYETLQSASKHLRERDKKVVDINQYRDKLR